MQKEVELSMQTTIEEIEGRRQSGVAIVKVIGHSGDLADMLAVAMLDNPVLADIVFNAMLRYQLGAMPTLSSSEDVIHMFRGGKA